MPDIDTTDLDRHDWAEYMADLPSHYEVDHTVTAFPSCWGAPPGAPYSEERARWIRDRVAESFDQAEAEQRGYGGEEHAEGGRFGAYPADWGIPRGSMLSDERAAWVKSNVEKHMVATPLRELRRRVAKMQNEARLAHLLEIKDRWGSER